MQLGIIGLGKMGANMARRLLKAGHHIVGFDVDVTAVQTLTQEGASGAASLEDLVTQLAPPRHLWMMVPAGNPVDQTIDALRPLLDAGDVLIDGGNTNYHDTRRRAAALKNEGFQYVDVGTSGGIWGLEEGYSLMVGGDDEVVKVLHPIFESLAPAPDLGWGHVGPSGAGHFVKMVHNGIEYGIMQAFAEGFDILQHKPELVRDLQQVAEVWRFGSVIRSWLLDLIADALDRNPTLDGITAQVADSGEGRWTVAEAIDLNVAAPVITLALLNRIESRDEYSFSERMLSMMRNQFGGHAAKEK